MEILKEISAQLQFGDDEKVFELTKQAIEQKIDPQIILADGLLNGMSVISEQFRNHDIFLPEVLLIYKGRDSYFGKNRYRYSQRGSA